MPKPEVRIELPELDTRRSCRWRDVQRVRRGRGRRPRARWQGARIGGETRELDGPLR